VDVAVPPWFRSLWTGIGAETSEWSNSFASTTNDMAEILAITGAHPGMTNGDHEGLYAEARKKSAFAFIIRGLTAFGSPSSPQLSWEIDTADGAPITLRASKEIWGDVLRKHEYDRVTATSEFIQRVGFDPNYMYRSHYEDKWNTMTATQEGLILQQQNPEQYAQFPMTAAFAFPDPPWAEFSFNVHRQRIQEDEKRVIDQDTHRALVNMQGGDLEYRNMMTQLEWRVSEMSVSGIPQADINKYEQDVRREITGWVESRWVGSLSEGLTPDGWLTSDKAIPTQMYIRGAIDDIAARHPDFLQLAREAIVPQLKASRETWNDQNPTSNQIFDYLSSPDPTPSMEMIPFEMLQEAG